MLTIKIETPEGYEIDSFDQSAGEIKLRLKKGPVTEIKTLDALLAYHGKSREGFEKVSTSLMPHERAFRILDLLARTLNEGWVPDWNNSREYKWYPWFKMDGSFGFRFDGYVRWNSRSNVGSRLCFKTKELAEHAGRNFVDIYEQFMVLK